MSDVMKSRKSLSNWIVAAIVSDRGGHEHAEADASRFLQRHPLNVRVTNRIGDLALVAVKPHRAGNGAKTLRQDDAGLDTG